MGGESGWLRGQTAAGLVDSADAQLFQLTLRPHGWMMIACRMPMLVADGRQGREG
jgi:hypothetical protein